jgi:poly(3-hydroxybutyrate) depolymerase
MKKSPLNNRERGLYGVLAISAVLICIVIGMIFHTQALSSRITMLEKEVTVRSSQLAAYERSLCSTIREVGQLSKYSLQSAGYTRTYQVHTPANYDPSVRYPLIVSFDGIEGSGVRMEGYSGLDGLPAIIVYPNSLPGKLGFTAWQGAPYSIEGDRDVQFVSDILKTVV